ncbi:MAG: SMC-Scp complex subunit ScpB [Planctomycetaceae bacterium]
MNFPDDQFELEECDELAEELSSIELDSPDDDFSAGDLEEAYRRALEVLEAADQSTRDEVAKATSISNIDDDEGIPSANDGPLPDQVVEGLQSLDEFADAAVDATDLQLSPEGNLSTDGVHTTQVGNPPATLSDSAIPSVENSSAKDAARTRTSKASADSDLHAPFSDRDFPELSPGAPLTPRHVIEAALFVGGAPLTTKKLAGLFKGSYDNAYIEQQIDELNRHYLEQNRPYEIRLVEGGHRLVLRPEFERIRHRVFGFGPKEVRLSQDALEVLALIAYQQPIHRDVLEECGKKNVSNLVNQLVRRELVGVTRGKNAKDLTYHTTPRFLALFGIGSLDELPRPDDLAFK